MTRRPPKTKPMVLRALALFGLNDSGVAELLEHTPQTVGDWTHGRRAIPPVTHAALWYLVLWLTAVGPDDALPRGVLRLAPDDEVCDVLARAATAALSNAPDADTLTAGRHLVLQLVERLAAQARAERAAGLRDAKRIAGSVS